MIGVGIGLINSKDNEILNGNVVLFEVKEEEKRENECRRKGIDEGKGGFIYGKKEIIRLGYFDDIDEDMLRNDKSKK